MHAFCFSKVGEQLAINYPDANTDFFVLLTDFANKLGIKNVAMTVSDMKFGWLGVKDLLNYGFNVIIVDPTYSPIEDDDVIPVWVQRDINTLDKHYPDCVIIGELIPYFHKRRRLESIKSYFQDNDCGYKMDVLTSGWVVKNTTGNADRITSRLYEYVKERDYELENNNAKRRTR
ncbi:hypothetical protein [Salmonella phage S115]|uniref:Uncharacterized protein n=2 Tax=Kuttervirus TaxID=2169536 RepID=A0A2Z5HLB0_9CAUD|nr:hypothetical protein HYP66_gp068 [Salmonella phage S118]YP_009887440.1 hypothetical protein HYQ29_gp103 [Salmonella phage rabagast]AXC40419.1 hypothetical protein [Salmonella phage S115]QKE54718.1 hypothetical protein AC4HA11_0650 [Escherichia phage vB_EcoA_4HA11]AXC40985.1 hypothetical protein [Salmonella phage S118]QIQ61781.1 hypothetical protein rabagast_103 [Salmonella phage rabagast]